MYVITFTNEKGGVGKTANSTHLAAGLALAGYRVLLIDADPQGHASIAFGLDKEPGMYDLLVRGASWKQLLRPVPPERYAPLNTEVTGALLLLPGNLETFGVGDRLAMHPDPDAAVLRKRLQELSHLLDYVIIDTSPAPSKLQGALFVASDGLIVPTKCEILSFDGLSRTLQAQDGANRARIGAGMPPLVILGYLPTMYRPQTLEHKENLAELRKFGQERVFSPITNRIIWAEAAHFTRSLFHLTSDSKAAREAMRFRDQVIQTVEAQRVQA